ncbi:LysM peptidoglycan-binding domain-containing protein [Cytobacillus suaedae]|nr:LysM peptidoglycan-binding domain-containing protein [Cytobacillus suaedae]
MPNYSKSCLPGLTPYQVKEGETIYQIVQQFRIPLEAIKDANPTVDVEKLAVGETICLPRQKNFPSCSNGKFYFIQEGDSYYRIAHYFSIPLDYLLQANPNTNPNNLQIGQAICVPTDSPFAYCPPNTTPYQLKQGDSFYKLSQVFNVSLESIIQLNTQANPNQLTIGQYVCLPIDWKYFFDQFHHIAFMHPRGWSKVSHSPIRYEGDSGYFEVSSIIAAPPSEPSNVTPLNKVCESYAHDKFESYGSNPEIVDMTIDGQPACLILPSNDQSEDFNNKSSLIVKFPKPYVIGGSLSHYLFVVANKEIIQGIANTMKLLNVEKDQKLTQTQAENLVRRALGLANQPEVYVKYDHTINNQYLIQVFDIVDNHTATRRWYLVHPMTGAITNYM